MIREEALRWLKQAESDLRKALNDIRTEDFDSAAFWSQQAAEKSLRALLLNKGLAFRGHDLLEIAKILEGLGLDASEILEDLRELTIHYVISRYPNAANAIPSELYDERKARELVERARRVLEWTKRNLR